MKYQTSKYRRQNYLWVLISIILLALIAGSGITILYNKYISDQEEIEAQIVEEKLDIVALEFKSEIEKFSILVLGLRSFIQESERFPSPTKLQQYLSNFNYTDYTNSFLINYFDTSHNFMFTISESSIFINELAGKNISDIRDSSIIAFMDQIIKTDGLHAQPPLNLIEGFAGLPINFRVEQNNEVIGYLTPIIDIKNIIKPVKEANPNFSLVFNCLDESFQKIYFDEASVFDQSFTKIIEKSPDFNYQFKSVDSYGMLYNVGIQKNDSVIGIDLISFIKNSYLLILGFILISAFLTYFLIAYLLRSQDLKHHLKKLERLNEILKKFIYASSHDLKQPLSNINKFSTLLARSNSAGNTETSLELSSFIESNVKRMDTILDELIIYSDIITTDLAAQNLSLNTIVDELIDSMESEYNIISRSELGSIVGNPKEIRNLFRQIFLNAIRFNKNAKKEIQIRANKDDNKLFIEIEDNGIGIPANYSEKVFEPFQRLNPADYEGSGLGLSICKEIANKHGALISHRQSSTSGSIFQITFPI